MNAAGSKRLHLILYMLIGLGFIAQRCTQVCFYSIPPIPHPHPAVWMCGCSPQLEHPPPNSARVWSEDCLWHHPSTDISLPQYWPRQSSPETALWGSGGLRQGSMARKQAMQGHVRPEWKDLYVHRAITQVGHARGWTRNKQWGLI